MCPAAHNMMLDTHYGKHNHASTDLCHRMQSAKQHSVGKYALHLLTCVVFILIAGHLAGQRALAPVVYINSSAGESIWFRFLIFVLLLFVLFPRCGNRATQIRRCLLRILCNLMPTFLQNFQIAGTTAREVIKF